MKADVHQVPAELRILEIDLLQLIAVDGQELAVRCRRDGLDPASVAREERDLAERPGADFNIDLIEEDAA